MLDPAVAGGCGQLRAVAGRSGPWRAVAGRSRPKRVEQVVADCSGLS